MAPVSSRFLRGIALADLEENVAIAVLAWRLIKRRKKKRRRWWVHPIKELRPHRGAYSTLVEELSQDGETFKKYFRLGREQFAQVLYHIRADITRLNNVRESISARERLAVTLRFLATGETYASLAMQYRLGISTISGIVPEVCNAIWNRMSNRYMKAPDNEGTWKLIAANFREKWQFPNCVGSIDGKHVVVTKPWSSGSLYYNYKGTCSVVLMALVDANYKFIAIDVGSCGRNSDAGIFARCTMGRKITKQSFGFPKPEPIPLNDGYSEPLPYVVVGDEAFPLLENLLRPYPGRGISQEKQLFNYRLSRSRRVVENAFGILAARWRVFHSKLMISPDRVNAVVKATCVLHNMLQSQSTPAQITSILQDAPDPERLEGLRDIENIRYRWKQNAAGVRDAFKNYFLVDESVPWQFAHVRRGLGNQDED